MSQWEIHACKWAGRKWHVVARWNKDAQRWEAPIRPEARYLGHTVVSDTLQGIVATHNAYAFRARAEAKRALAALTPTERNSHTLRNTEADWRSLSRKWDVPWYERVRPDNDTSGEQA
jgi:hypothetical protein